MNALPPLFLLLGLPVAWELAVCIGQVPAYLVPAPGAIGARWLPQAVFFATEGGISLAEALAGLAVGGGVAFLAGVVMACVRWLDRGLLPLAIVLKMTPPVVVWRR